MSDNFDWRLSGLPTLREDWMSPVSGTIHKKGTPVIPQAEIKLSKKKKINFHLPSASALFLSASSKSWNTSREIRKASNIDSSIKNKVNFTNEELAFDFIEEVMTSVVMAVAAVESFFNSVVPDDFEIISDEKVINKRVIEKDLSLNDKIKIVSVEVLDHCSLSSTREYSSFNRIKKIRDRIIHMNSVDTRSCDSSQETIWKEVFKIEAPAVVAIKLMRESLVKSDRELRWLSNARI